MANDAGIGTVSSLLAILTAQKNRDAVSFKNYANTVTTYGRIESNAASVGEWDSLISAIGVTIEGESNPIYKQSLESERNVYLNKRNKAFDISGMKERVSKVKANWVDLKHDGIVRFTDADGVKQEKKIGDLIIDDIRILDADFSDIYNDYYWTLENMPKSHANYITKTIEEDIKLIADSYDAAMADLAITERISPDDWRVLKNNPLLLERMRENKINIATTEINKKQPRINKINKYLDSGDYGINLDTIIAEGIPLLNATTVAELIGDMALDESGTRTNNEKINEMYMEMSRVKGTNEAMKMGVDFIVQREHKRLNDELQAHYRSLRLWGGTSKSDYMKYSDLETRNNPHTRIEQELLTLSEGAAITIEDGLLQIPGTNKYVWTSNITEQQHILEENPDNPGKYIISSPEKDLGNIDNPTLYGIKQGQNIAEFAWYLYNKDEYPENPYQNNYINSETEAMLNKKDIVTRTSGAIVGALGFGGEQQVGAFLTNTNDMMVQIKKLEQYLIGTDKIKVKLSDGTFKEIPMPGNKKFTGIKEISDMETILSILQKYSQVSKYSANNIVQSPIFIESNLKNKINNVSASWQKSKAIK